MSTNEMRTEAEQQGQSLGSRLTKKLSKRLSIHSGSKEEAREGAFASSSNASADERPIGQTALKQGQEIKDQVMQGEDTRNIASQGEMKGAATGIGLTGDNVNKNAAEQVSKRLDPYRSSISPGPIEYNDDIKKGPITTGIQRDTGQAGRGGIGGSSQDASLDTSDNALRPNQSIDSQASKTISQSQQQPSQAGSAIGAMPTQLQSSKDHSKLSQGEKGMSPGQQKSATIQKEMGQNTSTMGSASGIVFGGEEMMQQELRDQLAMDDDVFGTLGSEKMTSKPKSKSASKHSGKTGFGALGGGAFGKIFRRASGQEKSSKGQATKEQPLKTTSETSQSSKTTEQQKISRGTTAGIGAGVGAAAGLGAMGMSRSTDKSGTEKTGIAQSGAAQPGMTNTGMTNTGMTNTGMTNTGMANTGMANIGMSRAVDNSATRMTGSGAAQTRMATAGMTNNGMAESGMGKSAVKQPSMIGNNMHSAAMNSNGKASIDLSRHGGTVRGGTAVMSGTTESPKTPRSSGKTGAASATGAAGAAGMAGMAGMAAKPGMSGQPATTGTREFPRSEVSNRQGLPSDVSSQAYAGATRSSTTNTSGVSTQAVRGLSTGTQKVTVLQDKVQAVSQKCKTQLGVSSSEISKRSPSVDAFFDAVAAERLRWMPRDGSRLDCSLRWASRLAYAVDALRESTGLFAPGADAAAQLIWGFLILLLESDLNNADLLESIFGRYGRVAVGIYLLLQYESAYKTSPELQPEVAAVFADLLEMVCTTTTSCVEGLKAKESIQLIEHNVDAAFITYAKRYSTHWNAIVEASTSRLVKESSLIYSSSELGSLRQFLGVQDRPLQFILESRMHSLAEGSFEWFNSTLFEFSVGKSPVMLVTGGAGSGKSALAQWTVERLQGSAEHDNWNVIPYTIRADIPVATLTLRILKGVLHQMLDHCVSDKQTQEAILVHVAKAAQGALDGATDLEVEECLWRGISTGLASNIQYMFVVDGLDQIKGGDADAVGILDKFTDILSEQNAGSKMIAFTRPLSSKPRSSNVEQFMMQTNQTRDDLVAFVTKVLSGSHFDTSKSDQLQSAVAAIVNRSQGSFSWAEMAIEYAKQHRTLAQAVAAVQTLPQAMTELLDFHVKNLDLSQHEAVAIMSWLAASERPLLTEEIEQLLSVDPKGPSFKSRMSSRDKQWAAALRPLVTTREGVVSFAHTSIRDHVIRQAKTANAKSPLNLKEAHLDLLMRCLGWVQLSVREETDVSIDKLSMDERNRLFDKYVILEYTARYWISHLLSSPMVSDDGEFQFTPGFQKLLPATVLFARTELTCKESQFTRSSVVELYRLATDIRRLVLGEKSMGLLESLLLSARVSRLAHASHADEHCYDAWRLSQELLGQSDPITLTCADMMTQSFSERGTMTAQQEDIMKYLILTDSEITGVDFNQRLKYLGMIVGMYKSRGDNNSALLISKEFYQQVLQKYGTNSRQSTEAAEFLTSQFSTTGSDEMTRDIARTKYDNVIRTMEVTDERRIKYSLYMAQLYEQQGEPAQASSVLSSLWTGLNARDIDSVDMMDKKANVALVYYQFLRRQGRNDEAEVIMRELVADLEVSGIQSPGMMQRVQLLRAETREMQLYNLDRSLSILMWRYYKQNHQEYTPEARSLAMSLAEGMANSVSIEDSTLMSGNDRKLMVELLDSIASSPSNISVPTLILCHNLASIYVREEDWTEASDCSKAVLQHVYPTVETAGSHKKFTTEMAPPIADLALILAYCHFRRLHLDPATIVYENAFGSLVSSDRVPVASVLAVAKAVVEFYETTYQFTKALTLLHTVSSFLTARLGETHKHTIDNMYIEAALAKRLEKNQEAETTYQRIYKNTLHGNTIAPEGMNAALALIEVYESQMKWSSALEVYRHLWPTVVVQDNMQAHDRTQTERLLEKTYIGYMTILTIHMKNSDFTERYKVSSDYVMTCRNVYGPTHQKTLSATLLFAELCETQESYIDQAIALYKKPLQTSEWVPTSQSTKGLDQMDQALPITLKHKLAQLFVRKRDSTSEARSLYTEEFQLGKKTQGLFSTTTLSWLRELALAHSRQGTPTSVQQGNALLHSYVNDCLHAGGDPDLMADWARKIAAIYLECGFIEGGNNALDELRQRVVSGPELSAMPLSDRQDAIFVAAFEEAFGRRASVTQIMTEMTREMQTQQAFTKNLSGHDFIPTMISGDRLARLQTEQNRTRAATTTRSRLYEYFCATLSATPIADRDVVKQFYKICLREVHHDKYNRNILKTTTDMVRDLRNSSRFQDASDLTGVLHSFLHLTDGLNDYENIITASKLCLYLSGHQATRCENKALQAEMSAKSKMLLQELMASSKTLGIEIVDLPFHELNDIITLLGEHEMFDDLEGILTQLWTSRIVQRTWTPDVVVWIGRRLVETRFCRGSVDSAIQLCRDICYNLRQCWGSCDPVTLEMTKLLSGLFTASGDHKSAAALHEGALHDMLADSNAKNHPSAADTASQHMELLRRAQSRVDAGSDKNLSPTSSSPKTTSPHTGLMSQVAERFGLQSEQLAGVGDANRGESFGVWSRPRRFSIDVEDLDDQGQAHHNNLRQSSGAGLMNGSGVPRRISVQAL